MALVSEHTYAVEGLPVFWRSGPVRGGATQGRPSSPAPPLYLHGVPNASEMWLEFLQRTGGVALDLPGFGRSGKPADFDYSIAGYDRFLERFLDLLGAERVSLVAHDWGGVGLALAQRLPGRVARLVLIDVVPLLPGYRWHPLARVWRTPVLGELLMGSTTPRTLRLLSRQSNARPGPLPEDFLETVMTHFDHGTQRAILRLYRSAPEDVLAQAGSGLGAIDAPTLVVWGERDPYIPPCFADAYAQALGQAEVLRLADAGHWPWLDRPELIDRIARFLSEP